MYEELLKSVDAMAVAARRGDYVQRGERQARAFAILSGLETSLDFEQGGEIARGLVVVYREARRLLVAGGRDGGEAMIAQAREMLGEIASAWAQIGLPKD
jgi:flagellar protein FliS